MSETQRVRWGWKLVRPRKTKCENAKLPSMAVHPSYTVTAHLPPLSFAYPHRAAPPRPPRPPTHPPTQTHLLTHVSTCRFACAAHVCACTARSCRCTCECGCPRRMRCTCIGSLARGAYVHALVERATTIVLLHARHVHLYM